MRILVLVEGWGDQSDGAMERGWKATGPGLQGLLDLEGTGMIFWLPEQPAERGGIADASFS